MVSSVNSDIFGIKGTRRALPYIFLSFLLASTHSHHSRRAFFTLSWKLHLSYRYNPSVFKRRPRIWKGDILLREKTQLAEITAILFIRLAMEYVSVLTSPKRWNVIIACVKCNIPFVKNNGHEMCSTRPDFRP